jgi:hypothetical protein
MSSNIRAVLIERISKFSMTLNRGLEENNEFEFFFFIYSQLFLAIGHVYRQIHERDLNNIKTLYPHVVRKEKEEKKYIFDLDGFVTVALREDYKNDLISSKYFSHRNYNTEELKNILGTIDSKYRNVISRSKFDSICDRINGSVSKFDNDFFSNMTGEIIKYRNFFAHRFDYSDMSTSNGIRITYDQLFDFIFIFETILSD